jgi:hypothetical protein
MMLTQVVEITSFIFWPVGCGDATTVVISDSEVLQIDLNDCALADEVDNGRIPVVDELIAKLPKRNGKPYLSCFVLTHPDEDHCRGFANLLKYVTIGELWHTPRIFREYHKDLCADAQAFRKEAGRRREETIAAQGDPGSGNRVRVFGYDDLLKEEKYQGLPREFLQTHVCSVGQFVRVTVFEQKISPFATDVVQPAEHDGCSEETVK